MPSPHEKVGGGRADARGGAGDNVRTQTGAHVNLLATCRSSCDGGATRSTDVTDGGDEAPMQPCRGGGTRRPRAPPSHNTHSTTAHFANRPMAIPTDDRQISASCHRLLRCRTRGLLAARWGGALPFGRSWTPLVRFFRPVHPKLDQAPNAPPMC